MLVCNVICFSAKETIILIIYRKYANFGILLLALDHSPRPLALGEMPKILVVSILLIKFD